MGKVPFGGYISWYSDCEMLETVSFFDKSWFFCIFCSIFFGTPFPFNYVIYKKSYLIDVFARKLGTDKNADKLYKKILNMYRHFTITMITTERDFVKFCLIIDFKQLNDLWAFVLMIELEKLDFVSDFRIHIFADGLFQNHTQQLNNFLCSNWVRVLLQFFLCAFFLSSALLLSKYLFWAYKKRKDANSWCHVI